MSLKREKYRTPGPGTYDDNTKLKTLKASPKYTFGGKLSKIDRWKTGIYYDSIKKINEPV